MLLLHNELGYGGSGSSLLCLLDSLCRNYNLILVCNKLCLRDREPILNFLGTRVFKFYVANLGEFHFYESYQTSFVYNLRSLLFYVFKSPFLFHILHSNKVTSIHYNSTCVTHHAFLLKLLFPHIRQTAHIREKCSPSNTLANLFSFLWSYAGSSQIFISQDLSRLSSRASDQPFTDLPSSLIYNPILYYAFNSLEVCRNVKEYQLQTSVNVLWMGQFRPEKGPDLFLELYNTFLANYSTINYSIHFILLGLPANKLHPYYSFAQKILAGLPAYNANANIKLTAMEWTNPIPHLSRSHFIVRTSRNNDPWGRDIIEGLSSGCIPIATGIRSPFYNSSCGMLIGDWDAGAACRYIHDLASNPSALLEKVSANYVNSYSLFSPAIFSDKITRFFA